MSFSGDIKHEISRQLPESYHCLVAELAAIIHYAGTVTGDGRDGTIVVETENILLAKKYLQLIRKAFDIKVSLNIRKYPRGKSNLYCIVLSSKEEHTPEETEQEGAKEIFVGDKFHRVWEETANWESPEFSRALLEYSCCRRAFLRGAFLTSGSISNPGKSYHFELVCRKEQGAKELCAIMETFGIAAKVIQRKNKFVVYLKDSESIVDMLNVINATNALLKFENVRIIKEMKNSVNRQTNCDAANINKVVKTATRQLEDIRFIQKEIGLQALAPALQEMAIVRLEHPADSLQELGAHLDPPVGKSGVNHRLKKLSAIASELREQQGYREE